MKLSCIRKLLMFFLAGVFAILFNVGCENVQQSNPESKTIGLKPFINGYQRFTDRKQHTNSTRGNDFDPDISPDGRYIAYASSRQSDNPHIYIKKIDGQAITQITTGPYNDIAPSFSYDGKMLSFASNRNGNWDIFIVNVYNPKTVWQVTISKNDDMYPTWSPDGRMVAYCSKSIEGKWEIWTFNLKTNSLTNIGPGYKPKWCPDDPTLIMFQRCSERENKFTGIWLVHTDGTGLTEIVSNDNWSVVDPAWSGSGRYIAFSTVYKRMDAKGDGKIMGDDIWIVNRDGEGFFQVTDTPEGEWSPVWEKDNRIYFISDKGNKQNIWSVRPIIPAPVASK